MDAKSKYNQGLRFEQFNIGDRFVTASRTITESDIWGFSCLTGDWNPLHSDEEYCAAGRFGTRIAHGLLVTSIGAGLASRLLIFEGTAVALLETHSTFLSAVKPGNTIRAVVGVTGKKEIEEYRDRGIVIFECDILNQDNETVARTNWVVMILKQD